MTDSELIDWLETREGYALISDDFGRWAVVANGIQTAPEDISIPSDLETIFYIKADEWKPSIREAIQATKEKSDDMES